MAFFADMPFAQACGMGLNSFFCTIFVAGAAFAGVSVIRGYQAGLVIVFVSGLVFLILSVTGLRKYIAVAMPECLKKSIPAGIGLFIALIGLKNATLIQDNPYTFVQFFDFHGVISSAGSAKEAIAQIAPPVVAFVGFIIIAILAKLNVKGNIIIGILVSTVLYYVMMLHLTLISHPSDSHSRISVQSDFSEYLRDRHGRMHFRLSISAVCSQQSCSLSASVW